MTINRKQGGVQKYGEHLRDDPDYGRIHELARQLVDYLGPEVLFPLGQAVMRLLTNKGTPPASWEKRLTTCFGEAAWKDRFYTTSVDKGLFDEDEISVEKTAGFKEINDYMVERLKTIFPAVHPKPYPLRNSQNVPLFLLIFAVGNPNKKATNLAMKIADHLLKEALPNTPSHQ